MGKKIGFGNEWPTQAPTPRADRIAFAAATAIDYLLDAGFTRSEYYVLGALAKAARPARGCWPALDTIAAKTRLSQTIVQRALKSLTSRGLVLHEHCTADVRAELAAIRAPKCHGQSGGNHYHIGYLALVPWLNGGTPSRVPADLVAAAKRQPARIRREFGDAQFAAALSEAIAAVDAVDAVGTGGRGDQSFDAPDRIAARSNGWSF